MTSITYVSISLKPLSATISRMSWEMALVDQCSATSTLVIGGSSYDLVVVEYTLLLHLSSSFCSIYICHNLTLYYVGPINKVWGCSHRCPKMVYDVQGQGRVDRRGGGPPWGHLRWFLRPYGGFLLWGKILIWMELDKTSKSKTYTTSWCMSLITPLSAMQDTSVWK